MQQQSFPVTEARVVTEATPPLAPSSPKTALTLLLAVFAGGSIGVAGAFARELLDGSIRDPDHLERELAVRCFGVLPSIERPHASLLQSFVIKVPGFPGLIDAVNGFRRVSATGPDVPLRRVKMALDRGGRGDGGRAIGIVSPHQSWERASVSVKLATMCARSGQRTLLVDGDLRDASLTRLVSPGLRSGLLGALQIEPAGVEDFKRHELGFDLLGVNASALQDSHEHIVKHDPTDIMQSPAMHELMASLKRRYTYIVVDLPPVLESVDATAAVELFDAICVVADMKTTGLKDVDRALKSSEPLLDRLLGVVLIKPATTALAA